MSDQSQSAILKVQKLIRGAAPLSRKHAIIAIYASLGALLRFYLGRVTGFMIPTSNWAANVVGGFMMGAMLAWNAQAALDDHTHINDLLYVGVTSGMAGSTTTFSAFVASSLQFRPKWWVILSPQSAAHIIAGILMCMAGLQAGKATLAMHGPAWVTAAALILLVMVISIDAAMQDAFTPLFLLIPPGAALGAFIRVEAARLNKFVWFPSGTWIVNLIGTAIYIFTPTTRTWVDVLVRSAFAGSLTTLSTLCKEVTLLGWIRGAVYLAATVLPCAVVDWMNAEGFTWVMDLIR